MGKIVNPYSVSADAPLQGGVYADHASRKEGMFLYRVIDIQDPIAAEFVYSGWWFRQTIHIDGECVWRRISWLTIEREAQFVLPKSIDPLERSGAMEINFSPGLMMRRFRIWIEGQLIYDEVA